MPAGLVEDLPLGFEASKQVSREPNILARFYKYTILVPISNPIVSSYYLILFPYLEFDTFLTSLPFTYSKTSSLLCISLLPLLKPYPMLLPITNYSLYP
jgi:hypothetical protein